MFDLEPQEARLLLDIALMATGSNRFQSAETILSALKTFRPEAESLDVAEAILLLSRGAKEEALDFIDSALAARFPDSAMLKTFRGMALQQLGDDSSAHAAFAEAAGDSRDPAAAQLAKELLK